MPSDEMISEIRERAAGGESVNSIKNDLDLPKSTVYYHFRKEVGQKQKANQVQIPQDDEFIGELCGIFAGDGGFQKTAKFNYKIKIHLNAKEEYWDILAKYFTKQLDKKPFICDSRDTKVSLLYNSKKLYELFEKYLEWHDDKTLTVGLQENFHYSNKFKIGFIRGLIDTDGHLKEDRKYLFTTISRNLKSSIQVILDEFKFEHSEYIYEDPRENHRTCYTVRCPEVQRFNSTFSPRNPKKSL